jgi:hypothetical protein
MRKFFVIATTIALFSLPLTPAFAGSNYGDENLGRLSECEVREFLGESPCRRLTEGEAFVLGKTIEALGNIAGAAIVNEGREYRPRHYRERYEPRDLPRRGHWVDKWEYERSGRACPGPIGFWGGTYWCRVR